MLSFSGSMRIFVYSLPTDMRRQFDGLSSLVTNTLQRNVYAGDYFVFFNRSRTMCKILAWGSDGFQMYSKRLARGTFERPSFDGRSLSEEVDMVTLAMLLGGIELKSVKRRPRYRHPDTTPTNQTDHGVSSRQSTASPLSS